jgi:uncharacterized protein
MVFDIIIISIGLLLTIIGLIGCIVPAVPGPPLNYIALLLLEWAVPGDIHSLNFYLVLGIITILSIILDYVFPVWAAKKYKASNTGIWGSVIGMILGIVFFPPFGMIAGLLVGAVLGELIAGKKNTEAMKTGMVTFISSLIMIVFKFAISGVMTYYFFKAAAEFLI